MNRLSIVSCLSVVFAFAFFGCSRPEASFSLENGQGFSQLDHWDGATPPSGSGSGSSSDPSNPSGGNNPNPNPSGSPTPNPSGSPSPIYTPPTDGGGNTPVYPPKSGGNGSDGHGGGCCGCDGGGKVMPPPNIPAADRCGNNGDKVIVCHAPGGDEGKAHSLCIPWVAAQNGHRVPADGSIGVFGDYLGPCKTEHKGCDGKDGKEKDDDGEDDGHGNGKGHDD